MARPKHEERPGPSLQAVPGPYEQYPRPTICEALSQTNAALKKSALSWLVR